MRLRLRLFRRSCPSCGSLRISTSSASHIRHYFRLETDHLNLSLPTELSTFAFEQAPKSTLVIRHGDDHVSMDRASSISCYLSRETDRQNDSVPSAASHPIQVDFIRTGVLPAARDDALVTVIPPGGKRGALADPYKVAVGAIAGDMSAIENIQDFAPLPSPSGALPCWGTSMPMALLLVGVIVCL